MKSLNGTQTEKNINNAFTGESRVFAKYTFFSNKAKQEGFNEIAQLFEKTANNERSHAELWFKYFHNNEMPSTAQNLQLAIDGENYEWSEMYPEYAKVARDEGFDEIADLFEEVGKIEKQHEQAFNTHLEQISNSEVFNKNNDIVWICTNCGYTTVDKAAPLKCPVCKLDQAYFMEKTN